MIRFIDDYRGYLTSERFFVKDEEASLGQDTEAALVEHCRAEYTDGTPQPTAEAPESAADGAESVEVAPDTDGDDDAASGESDDDVEVIKPTQKGKKPTQKGKK